MFLARSVICCFLDFVPVAPVVAELINKVILVCIVTALTLTFIEVIAVFDAGRCNNRNCAGMTESRYDRFNHVVTAVVLTFFNMLPGSDTVSLGILCDCHVMTGSVDILAFVIRTAVTLTFLSHFARNGAGGFAVNIPVTHKMCIRINFPVINDFDSFAALTSFFHTGLRNTG